jgi:hypothetical protein
MTISRMPLRALVGAYEDEARRIKELPEGEADKYDRLRKLKGAADAKRDPSSIPANIAAELGAFGRKQTWIDTPAAGGSIEIPAAHGDNSHAQGFASLSCQTIRLARPCRMSTRTGIVRPRQTISPPEA